MPDGSQTDYDITLKQRPFVMTEENRQLLSLLRKSLHAWHLYYCISAMRPANRQRPGGSSHARRSLIASVKQRRTLSLNVRASIRASGNEMEGRSACNRRFKIVNWRAEPRLFEWARLLPGRSASRRLSHRHALLSLEAGPPTSAKILVETGAENHLRRNATTHAL